VTLLAAATQSDDVLVAQNIGFGVIAAIMIFGALRVVTVKNVVHAALWLVLVMAGAAGQYILVTAEFVAVTQVLVYIGAVMVLFLFGTMLTRARIGAETDLNNKHALAAVPVGLVMLGAMVWVLIDGWGDDKLPQGGDVPVTTAEISDNIFKPYLLPFWALSFLLLIAMIGAIVLARKD
jgi:NADH-quinone oxidoreductase subunit J